MIINDKRKATTVKFEDIEDGQCFICPDDNSVCMKLNTNNSNSDNVVCFKDGQTFWLGSDYEVIKVNSRLEIW